MKLKFKRIIGSVSQTKLAFFILGIGSTIWFLIRVIPKPSRATYPCMKASAPFMSAFVLYLIGLSATVYVFKEKKGRLLLLKSVLGIVFVISLLISFKASIPAAAPILENGANLTANTPIGVAKGIFPGRVVWVMDKDATNEYCSNADGDYWFMDQNTDQAVVEKMLGDGIKKISGENTSAKAWDAIFKYFNSNHNKGAVGYKTGEKVVVKINCTTLGNGGRKLNDALNATPQLAMALLEQLIDTMKIAQANITLGDPYRGMPDEIFNPCHAKYPNVHYIEGLGTDGRELTKISTANMFFTSDNKFKSRLPQAYLDAAYLINMPSLKTHNSAGITLGAKNHQGSVIDASQNAMTQSMINYLHYDYPVDGGAKNQTMGIYRHIVDYMAHKNLGGNTLIYIVDGLWSGRNWDGQIEKWEMPPFNGDWTSSLFLSQDPVAIESVGFDFLYNEYKDYPAAHDNANYPLVLGVQDYIYQAADPSKWPIVIKYDPSSATHSSPIASLGVEEHWNNKTAKQYSRNLGSSNGIELISVPSSLVISTSVKENPIEQANSLSVFPNPVVNVAILKYALSSNANVQIGIYSLDGKQVIQTQKLHQLAGVNTFSLNVKDYQLTTGTYICKVIASGSTLNTFTSKIVIK
jgi:hypothetical protein